MEGRATAPAAGTILNALATGTGAAFAIDLETTATVELDGSEDVSGTVGSAPDADTTLIERCIERTLEHYREAADLEASIRGGTVATESEVPLASGLKSSSAAANATVLATLDALGLADDVDRLEACLIGVEAARDAGVTVTGALDDASASMLGGVTITDNTEDRLLEHDRAGLGDHAAIYTPPEQSFSADADVDACKRIDSMATLVAELALDGRYAEAMTVNGFAFCGALECSTQPVLEALPDAAGVSLSGTGPSYVAVGERNALERVCERWRDRPGTARLVRTRTDGATTL
ncbi:shikimate kinase [Natronosalvus halobius]|uniref:shikimate kinase n=1 Tax=Natronosalvus halobius TaxID=2953746 RepID=UPI00209E2DE0|nr:shikimate kinase [Natronosalvus halobius]USZ72567.1 shikimate kinase [Natronosalvus halobius]